MAKPPSKSTRYVLSLVRFLLGCLFVQHGLEKLWGFAGSRMDRDFSHLHGLAGPIEFAGGVFLILGLFIRPTAFILCGEMAVAYFVTWAPHGFWPISNGVGGELSVIDCFAFFWLVTAGAGPLSIDAFIKSRKLPGASDTRPGRDIGVLGRLHALHSPHDSRVPYIAAWLPDDVWHVPAAAHPL